MAPSSYDRSLSCGSLTSSAGLGQDVHDSSPKEGTAFLVSLVVRISACHVEGPGSIPGRGEIFGPKRMWPGGSDHNIMSSPP